MTKLLDEAVIAVRRLPPETQDDIARAMLMLAEGKESDEVYVLTPEEEAAIAESEAEVARGEFASDEEIRAVWAKFGL
ncbi:MAG: hypothetical protein HY765_07500 [Rhodomicrobium sp.]|nr:hypothetical protein [Rhodomicrobium sp.]